MLNVYGREMDAECLWQGDAERLGGGVWEDVWLEYRVSHWFLGWVPVYCGCSSMEQR